MKSLTINYGHQLSTLRIAKPWNNITATPGNCGMATLPPPPPPPPTLLFIERTADSQDTCITEEYTTCQFVELQKTATPGKCGMATLPPPPPPT